MSKPMNSFFLYCKLNRELVKLKYPNRPNADISSILGEQWRTMSIAEKQKYKDLALKHKKEFSKANPLPQKRKKDSDAFLFSFRLSKNKKPVKKEVRKNFDVPRPYPPTPIQSYPVPVSHSTRRCDTFITPRQMNTDFPPLFESDIEALLGPYVDYTRPYYNDAQVNSWVCQSTYSTSHSTFAPSFSPSSTYY